jgi:hypothetical protein
MDLNAHSNPAKCVVYSVLLLALAFASGAPAEPSTAAVVSAESRTVDFDPGALQDLTRHDTESATARIVFVTGVVDTIEKDFFGRPEKVAIVSVGDKGVLFQNAVEDLSAGAELKDHVGEGVTARGVVLVKADGSMSLLVDAFRVLGDEGGFVGSDSDADDD